MSRQSLVAAGGLFVVALLIAVTLYVSNLKAADSPLAPKPSATVAGADQIKQLQARIAALEKRLATLEKNRINTWEILPINPQSAPGLKFLPAPPLTPSGDDSLSQPWNDRDKDGFSKARIIFIDNSQPPITESDSGR